MDLIAWSLNSIDKIFSTRSGGTGEPRCPDGTFPVGYVQDYYGNWRTVCLSVLSVEDIEDVFIFGTLIVGLFAIGAGIALVYRKIGKLRGAQLPSMVMELGRANNQNATVAEDTNRAVNQLATIGMDNNRKLATLAERIDGTTLKIDAVSQHGSVSTETSKKIDILMGQVDRVLNEVTRH